MRFGTVCSGIGSPEAACGPLGWACQFQSEIESFPCAVLKHHYPDVPNYGDMTKFKEWPNATIDVLVGGTPCQSFSVAGLRKGLDDPRGNLMLTYLAIAARYLPSWVVWENVPGVLSSHKGKDFGTFLGGLAELGYGFAYRILDAQYFGVAQRRRRVFVVGHLGDWRRAAAVLFERASMSGHPAPCRETGKGVAPTISARTKGGGGLGTDFDLDGSLIPEVCPTLRSGGNSTGGDRPPGTDVDTCYSLIPSIAGCLQERDAKGADGDTKPGHRIAISPPLTGNPYGDHESRDGLLVPVIADTLRSASNSPKAHGKQNGTDRETLVPVAFANVSDGSGLRNAGDFAQPITNRHGDPGTVINGMQVRRLTPMECERLQGFQDGFTRIGWGKKPADQCPDGPRYKALGNSMAVPVMQWIGKRIQFVDGVTAAMDAGA